MLLYPVLFNSLVELLQIINQGDAEIMMYYGKDIYGSGNPHKDSAMKFMKVSVVYS